MRALVLADLHLHAYPHHNLEGDPDFRLKQFDRLADRIADIFVKEQCTDIILAGDAIQVPVIRPKVQHALFDFFEKLSDCVIKNGKPGSRILFTTGNHDKDSRSQEDDETTSVVTLLTRIDRVEYMDKKVIFSGNKSIGFQDYYGTHDLSWINDRYSLPKVNVLINHFTLGNRYFAGQTIDSSMFDVMIFGDIHKPFNRGNLISVGNPIGHRLGDCQDGTVLIFDTDESIGHDPIGASKWDWVNQFGIAYKWVKIIEPGVWDFLRIYRPDDKYVENKGQYKYDIEVPYAEVPDVSEEDSHDLIASLDYEKILSEYMSTDRLSQIHGEMRKAAEEGELIKPPINLNFQLISMDIANFRSIDKCRVEWQGGAMLISGPLGTGKTTILKALNYAFLDDRSIREQVRNTMPPNQFLYVDLVFKYEGLFFRIDRGWDGSGYLYFWMGTEDEVMRRSYLDKKIGRQSNPEYFQHFGGNSKGDVTLEMKRRLRFLEMWKLIYIDQFSSGLMASMDESERVSMISRILGWETILTYNSIASQVLKTENSNLSRIRENLNNTMVSISTLESLGLVRDDTDYDTMISTLDTERTECSKYVQSFSEYQLKKASLDGYESQIAKFVRREDLESVDVEDLVSRIKTTTDTRDNVRRAVENNTPTNLGFISREGRISRAKAALERLENSVVHTTTGSCHACGQDIHDPAIVEKLNREREEQIRQASHELESAIKVHDDFLKELAICGGSLAAGQMLVDGSNNNLRVMDQSLQEIRSYRRELANHENLKTSLEQLKSSLSSYTMTDPAEESRCQARVRAIGEEIGGLRSKKVAAASNNSNLDKLETLKSSIKDLETAEQSAMIVVGEYEEYIRLTAISGPVVRSVLEECAKVLSNDKIEVRTTKELASGETRPDLSLNMKVGKNWVNYKLLSGGQLMTADLMFLLSLIKAAGGSGLLILDETFKFFDIGQIDEIGSQLKDCAARDVMIITHAESYVYADRVLLASMDSEGISHYEIRDLA